FSVSKHVLSTYDIDCTPEVKGEVIQCMGSFQDGVAEKCEELFSPLFSSTALTLWSLRVFLGPGEVLSCPDICAVQKVKNKALAIVDSFSADKAIAEEKLEAARPALEEAEAALQVRNNMELLRGSIGEERRRGKNFNTVFFHHPQANLAVQENRLTMFKSISPSLSLFPQTLLEDAERCRHKMQTSSSLISEFAAQTKQLVGVLISPSCPTLDLLIKSLITDWQREMKSQRIYFRTNLNLTEMLIDAPTVSEWNLQGLPNDDLSIQNGIFVTKAARFPLLIDAQTQGTIWIKNKESKNELQVTT
uniref:Dynein heavy chain ATP-binding dynein motor region domain-containing protein n=1 Tax=Cyprinus carpio carpio TaxID=630221 RepID=A0A9J8DL24_CYPCA